MTGAVGLDIVLLSQEKAESANRLRIESREIAVRRITGHLASRFRAVEILDVGRPQAGERVH